jgi:hypothetical protein
VNVTKRYFEDLDEPDEHGMRDWAYRYWVYSFDFDSKSYAFRRYTDDFEEASCADPPRRADLYDDRLFAAAVKYLIEEEGVERVTALSGPSGGYEPVDVERLLQLLARV